MLYRFLFSNLINFTDILVYFNNMIYVGLHSIAHLWFIIDLKYHLVKCKMQMIVSDNYDKINLPYFFGLLIIIITSTCQIFNKFNRLRFRNVYNKNLKLFSPAGSDNNGEFNNFIYLDG